MSPLDLDPIRPERLGDESPVPIDVHRQEIQRLKASYFDTLRSVERNERAMYVQLHHLRSALLALRDEMRAEAVDADAHTQCDLENFADRLTALLETP